jgi:hypothetical protein
MMIEMMVEDDRFGNAFGVSDESINGGELSLAIQITSRNYEITITIAIRGDQ